MNIKKNPKLSFDVRDKGCLKESLENNSDDESTGFNIIPDYQQTPDKLGETEEFKNEASLGDASQ